MFCFVFLVKETIEPRSNIFLILGISKKTVFLSLFLPTVPDKKAGISQKFVRGLVAMALLYRHCERERSNPGIIVPI